MSDSRRILVVGGGVIGVACAHYLQADGHQVTVIDRGAIGRGCSGGNCGLVCPSHVLPLAEPGAWREAIRALLQPGGAFRIKPRWDLSLWGWLRRFAGRCNRRDMLASGHAIQPLLASSLGLYETLVADEHLQCEWTKQGLLFVYRHPEAWARYRPINDLLSREYDEPAEEVPGDQLQAMEPALRSDLAGGWYFEHDAHLRPDRLMASWHDHLRSRGVRFLENHALQSLEHRDGRVTEVATNHGKLVADAVVVATGAWTPQLATLFRCRIPIQPGKGYSVLVPHTTHRPRIPLLFPEHRVVVTPFDDTLRLGSIMEFAGYDERIPPSRLTMLRSGAQHYLRDTLSAEPSHPWFGWRPMTYDSTPIIGACPNWSNVTLATGHNMLGLSMAPATGRLVSELIGGTTPHIDPTPYHPERFQ